MVCVFQDQQVTTRVVADVVGFLVYRKSLASTVRVNYFAVSVVHVRHAKFSMSVIWY